MADPSANGPLSLEELLALWTSSVDGNYSRPFLEAGDGGGLEAFTQGHAQSERVSQAIDTSTQAMFILPFSGQTAPPAQGPASATVALTFARAGFLQQPLVLKAGLIVVGELATDSGENGPVLVETGREYVLQEDVVFFPGDPGPCTGLVVAEKPGYGYNNPLPGTISEVQQVGSAFNNVGATITVVGQPLPGAPFPASRAQLAAANVADMFVPQHVGQYVLLTAGANAGKFARASAFTAPVSATNSGSKVDVEQLLAFDSFSGDYAGVLQVGETVDLKTGPALIGRCVVLAVEVVAGAQRVVAVLVQGVGPGAGDSFTGQVSAAAGAVDIAHASGTLTPEAGTAAWRVLDWASDWKLTAANAAQPAGGRSGMLDMLGAERNLPRQTGEDDDAYRDRIAQVADVVTPNAIRRALNRAMGAFPWCLREVGSRNLPGLYCDRTGDAGGDFYDTECVSFNGSQAGTFLFQEPVEYRDAGGNVVMRGLYASYLSSVGAVVAVPGATVTIARPRGAERPVPVAGDVIVGTISGATVSSLTAGVDNTRNNPFAVWLDYLEFRAFFLVSVPPVGFGEFGAAYDAGASNAYDAAPYDAFFDGFPAGAPAFYKRAYDAVDKVRAGGVTFDLVLSRGEGCA